MPLEQLGGIMKVAKTRRKFTPEFRLEAANLVLEQNYSVRCQISSYRNEPW